MITKIQCTETSKVQGAVFKRKFIVLDVMFKRKYAKPMAYPRNAMVTTTNALFK